MRRRPLPPPPSVAELGKLALRLAAEAPEALPALLWCVCRNSRAVRAFRTRRPSGVRLAALLAYPTGERLLASSRAGAHWLRRWKETEDALDELVPSIPRPPSDERR